MYQATKEALERGRSGEGPTLIEAVTYRLSMHTTADDPTRYQPPEQLRAWESRDPIPRFRKYLEAKGLWDEARERKLEEEIKEQVEGAVRSFEAKGGFKPDAPFDHVYGTRQARVEEQRAEFLENLSREDCDV